MAITTTMIQALSYIIALCALVAPAFAQGNGMDMSTDGPMDLAVGRMLPYLHFSPGDNLWFLGWVPGKAGTMVGACVGVFLLAMLERWLAACLGIAERHWVERASFLAVNTFESSESSTPGAQKKKWLMSTPFVLEYDITRGFLFAAQWSVKIMLMLAVMTFQLAFLFSVAIGSGVGETLFGRFAQSQHDH